MNQYCPKRFIKRCKAGERLNDTPLHHLYGIIAVR